ncbi:TetR/AcrR family transcriptional regulator [Synechocystis sp. PCC 7509]|uniref:TetR/AcrR family transcriptional regulator n=1 Tax=Synechocystis sp. PCC 7509 TaxID=927677 RepID=UPI0002AD1892|nr:TetR/AcrR family transcriptional regulator [Synechocystis sp. PCC 7509]
MPTEKQHQNRSCILDVTESLLRSIGRDAITIRAVADEAKVQLPTIYRLFGDKVGLLDAVAERGFTRYMAIDPEHRETLEPIEQLRHGWDIHVRFGLENPELYDLMYANPYSRKVTPAAQIALDGLTALIGRLAASGSLKVSQEEATFVAFSSASGVVLSTYFLPGVLHDPSYLENIRESMISSIAIKVNCHDGGLIANAATTLGGNLDQLKVLSPNEQNLLHEWLNRILASSRNSSFSA